MGDWDFPLVDFFDQRAVAINKHSHSLALLRNVERTAACRQIQDRVRTCVDALPDHLLLRAAVCMVDALARRRLLSTDPAPLTRRRVLSWPFRRRGLALGA